MSNVTTLVMLYRHPASSRNVIKTSPPSTRLSKRLLNGVNRWAPIARHARRATDDWVKQVAAELDGKTKVLILASPYVRTQIPAHLLANAIGGSVTTLPKFSESQGSEHLMHAIKSACGQADAVVGIGHSATLRALAVRLSPRRVQLYASSIPNLGGYGFAMNSTGRVSNARVLYPPPLQHAPAPDAEIHNLHRALSCGAAADRSLYRMTGQAQQGGGNGITQAVSQRLLSSAFVTHPVVNNCKDSLAVDVLAAVSQGRTFPVVALSIKTFLRM